MGAGSLINLHNHSDHSDGFHPIQEIVERAAKGGLTHLGITDHFETSKVRRCLKEDELPGYIRSIKALDGRSISGMRVLAGVEIDTNPERCDLDRLPVDKLNTLDLVLFEYVNDEDMGGCTLDELRPLLHKIEVPCGLVHTDIARVFTGTSPRQVADLLASHRLFVEVNTAHLYQVGGVPYYERAEGVYREFKGKVKVSVGTDMHRNLDEVTNIGKGYDFLRRLGLLDDLLL
jgi:histidinol phosphatase-like PHP family hydrolase